MAPEICSQITPIPFNGQYMVQRDKCFKPKNLYIKNDPVALYALQRDGHNSDSLGVENELPFDNGHAVRSISTNPIVIAELKSAKESLENLLHQ